MYTEFFGLTEKPFKLVPNPAYLFLGKSHQEAMAHLVYAVHQGEGFVEITGEVGTGKTTLCRSFLETLNGNTEAAYIFNPSRDSIELLKAINDEFGINSTAENAKDLIDALNRFLLDTRATGKTALIVIDEAQNLNREVLEQIRLLSNLETTRNKLLQIILVGQPELQTLLDSYELRQLRQRMTLSLSLEPFTRAETTAYIDHRLQIASSERQILFSRKALRRIYKYSQGIPRLINIACDRALLTAYGLNQKIINSRIVRKAISELQVTYHRSEADSRKRRGIGYGLLVTLLVVMALGVTALTSGDNLLRGLSLLRLGDNQQVTTSITKGVGGENKPAFSEVDRPKVSAETGTEKAVTGGLPGGSGNTDVERPLASTPPLDASYLARKEVTNRAASPKFSPGVDSPQLPDILGMDDFSLSRLDAFQIVMDLWGLDLKIVGSTTQLPDDYQFFHLAARQNGLMLYRINNDLGLIEKLDLPAIMKFGHPSTGAAQFLVLSGIEGDDFHFTWRQGNEVSRAQVGRQVVGEFWTGEAFIPWKNIFSIEGEIPHDPPDESMITLKLLLRDIGYGDIEIDPLYRAATRAAVMDIQQKHGLPVDGVVGSLTKIALYNEKGNLGTPSLKRGKQ